MNMRYLLFCIILFPISCIFHTANAQIYDCFLFYNEIEILTIRLDELYDHVDKFVLIEFDETFRGDPKPLYYQENKHLFEKFADKIIHVIVEGHFEPQSTVPVWAATERENYQRNQIARGLKDCADKDIILISDVDEILRVTTIKEIKNNIDLVPANQFKYIVCMLNYYGYYFNRFNDKQTPWFGCLAVHYEDLKKYSPTHFRRNRNRAFAIKNAGWHLSYMGGHERVLSKLSAFADFYLDTPENRDWQKVRKKIDAMPLVPIDESFPRLIYENQKEYIEKGFIDVPIAVMSQEGKRWRM